MVLVVIILLNYIIAFSVIIRKWQGLDSDGKCDNTEFVKEFTVKILDILPDVPLPEKSVSKDIAEELQNIEKEGPDLANQSTESARSEHLMNIFLKIKMGFSISSDMSSTMEKIIGKLSRSLTDLNLKK